MGILYMGDSLHNMYRPGMGPITIVICNRNRDYTNFLRDRVIIIVIVITVQCTRYNRNRNQLSHDPCNRNRLSP